MSQVLFLFFSSTIWQEVGAPASIESLYNSANCKQSVRESLLVGARGSLLGILAFTRRITHHRRGGGRILVHL